MPYVCKICEKSFLQLKSFTNHKKDHAEKPHLEKLYSCDLCMKSFSSESFLTIHKRAHSGEKFYECDECENPFATLGDLLRHIKKLHRKHFSKELNDIQKEKDEEEYEIKSFPCDLCDQTFTKRPDLVSHKRTHKKKNTIECDMCSKCFITSNDLSRHRVRVHREYYEDNVVNRKKAYVSLFKNECNICKKSFVYKERLYKHIEIIHKVYYRDNFIDTLQKEIKEEFMEVKDCDPLSIDNYEVNDTNFKQLYPVKSTSIFEMDNIIHSYVDNAEIMLPIVEMNKTIFDNLDEHNDEVDILKFKPIGATTSDTHSRILPVIDQTNLSNHSKSTRFMGGLKEQEAANSTSHINVKDNNSRNIDALRDIVDKYKKSYPIPKTREPVDINAPRNLIENPILNMTEDTCTIDDLDLRDLVEDHNKDIPEDTFAMDDLADDYENAIQVLVADKQNMKDSIIDKNKAEMKKTLFSCFVCDKLFVEKSDLLSHIASHRNKSSYSINDNSDTDEVNSSEYDEDSSRDSDTDSSVMDEVVSDNDVIIEDENTSLQSDDDSNISIKDELIE